MTQKAVLQKLKEYSNIETVIRVKHDEIARLNSLKYECPFHGIQKYGEHIKNTNVSDITYSAVEKILFEYDRLVSELADEIVELSGAKYELEHNVKLLPFTEQTLITLRFFQGKKWFQIENIMNYSQRQPYYIKDHAIKLLAQNWVEITDDYHKQKQA